MTSLDGRVAIVTGAASGIGYAMSSEFAARGARVVMVDVTADEVVAAAEKLAGEGSDAIAIVEDVASEGAAGRIAGTAVASFGALDVLCNNAGVMDRFLPAAELPEELWDRVLAINLTAPFLLCKAALPVMVSQGSGAIVNTASIAALAGGRAGAAYTVSKHGLVGLTRSVAAHYAHRGVRCNAICPGGIASNIGTTMLEPSALGKEVLDRTTPSAVRQGEPAEVARLAAFLASDDASLVSGAIVVADAGWTAT